LSIRNSSSSASSLRKTLPSFKTRPSAIESQFSQGSKSVVVESIKHCNFFNAYARGSQWHMFDALPDWRLPGKLSPAVNDGPRLQGDAWRTPSRSSSVDDNHHRKVT
jgi:hypothetical protein